MNNNDHGNSQNEPCSHCFEDGATIPSELFGFPVRIVDDLAECDFAKLQRVNNSADLLIIKDSVHEVLGYKVMR